MDPQACIYGILEAIWNDDRDTLDTLLNAMQQWNRRGGYLPQVSFGQDKFNPTLCASLHRSRHETSVTEES